MSCLAFFELNSNNSEICSELHKIEHDTVLKWESLKASVYSPGPVADSEKVVRQIFNPIHYDSESQELKPGAVTDAENKGMSTNRLTLTSKNCIIQQGNAKADRDNEDPRRGGGRKLIGLVTLDAMTIRSIKNAQGRRGLCVFDTALPDDKSHADVCLLLPTKQEARSIRSKLLDASNKGFELLD